MRECLISISILFFIDFASTGKQEKFLPLISILRKLLAPTPQSRAFHKICLIIPSTDKIVKQKMPPPGSISRFLFSFLDSGRFAGQPTQIEKFRATDNPAAFHFNLGQTR